MIEPEKPSKMKEQIRLDEELALKLKAEEDKQVRLAREKAKKVKEANISWDNVQAMIEADSIKSSKKRNKPPTKAQKKSTMSTYLKHMAGYKQSQLKNKSFAEIKKLFDKAMTRVNMFVDMDTKLVKDSSKKAEVKMEQESISKRAGEEIEQEKEKKQKIDDDQEEAEMKKLIKVVTDKEEVAIDAIPLATKPPSIVDWNIVKEGKISLFQIIRANGSSKRSTRPEEGYERVLWGNLRTMLNNIEDTVWRNLLGNKVLIWKLFDSYRVHFVRFQNMHLFMLVEKRYPLTPATITEMLNKKLQTDHLNEMCYQLRRIVRIKSFLMLFGSYYCYVEVKTVKVLVTAAKYKLMLLIQAKQDIFYWDQHFDNALANLGASVSVMPLSTYLSLRLGELAHTKLTVELADRSVKCLKGIAKNVLVGIGKFVFSVDFIILDMPQDIKVPLILGRPFLSIAHAKIDVFKRKITLRVGEEKIIFKSVKPASSLIKRVLLLGLRERMELDLEARIMGETLLKRDQVDDLMPTIKECEVVEEFRARNDARMVSKVFRYPSNCDHDKKIYIDCAYNLKFSYMIDFAVLEDMDAYHDEGMGDVIFGKPFLRKVGINAKWFNGMVTIHNGNKSVSEEDKMNRISHLYQKLKSFYKGVLNLGPEYVRDVEMEEWLTRGHISVHKME
ncbi:reverse transcriptase domain-containing protein [Tanacetum coccineum]|uniref:Reverse transcriptase domain-containing protein n=1 Tax=Tanacetum coccineum TaxID=301880 RepID=A0ABQ4YUD1_9ASTR